jgi:hypothetical protein
MPVAFAGIINLEVNSFGGHSLLAGRMIRDTAMAKIF